MPTTIKTEKVNAQMKFYLILIDVYSQKALLLFYFITCYICLLKNLKANSIDTKWNKAASKLITIIIRILFINEKIIKLKQPIVIKIIFQKTN